jgi:hypothetical protein
LDSLTFQKNLLAFDFWVRRVSVVEVNENSLGGERASEGVGHGQATRVDGATETLVTEVSS